MQLVVGRIARPHGIRGELAVEVRTDEPDQRFAVGSVLSTDPPGAGPLTVTAARWHSGRLLVRFARIGDIEQAVALRGIWLVVDSAEIPAPDEPDVFHDHQLIGLRVVTTAGSPVGTVADVLHQGQDVLVIEPGGGDPAAGGGAAGAAGTGSPDHGLLVPFVAAIAVEVDLAAGRLVIDPPPGLLELGAGGEGPAAGPGPEGGQE
jgi:16S rRNA processing protein RimM